MKRSPLKRSSIKKRRKKSRVSPGISMGTLDRLWSKVIRNRDKFTCQVCGRSDRRVEAAHCFGRGRRSVRYDLDNGATMCGGPNNRVCHRWMDEHDTEKKYWFCKRLGLERFRALDERQKVLKKVDHEAVKQFLKAELEKFGI